MDMIKIDFSSAGHDVEILSAKDKLKRKPKPLMHKNMLGHTAQILAWAKAKGSSKRKTARLISQKLGLTATPDQVYRFVKKVNGGIWPHKKNRLDGEKS